MNLAKERAHLYAENTVDLVEQYAACCQEAMMTVFYSTAKGIMVCPKKPTCWNSNFNDTRKVLEREKWGPNSNKAARAMARLQK
jgi:hypothetical protein